MATPRRVSGELRAPLASVKGLVTVGFMIMTAALALGATTKTGSGTGFAAAWLAAFGLGMGLAMPQTMNAALSALSAERSGSGSALISALRQVGATIGVAVLGTVLATVYRAHVGIHGLPAATAATAKSSVMAASAWRMRWGRRSCSTRPGPRSSRAWTPCCGPAAASRWSAPSWR